MRQAHSNGDKDGWTDGEEEGGRKTKVSADRLKLYNEFLHMDDPEVKVDPRDDISEPQGEEAANNQS